MKIKYKTIVVDPPWKYGVWGTGSDKQYTRGFTETTGRSRPIPYPTMSVEEIAKMNVRGLADDDCELYLWTTQRYLPDAFRVMDAWGFKYCQTLTWCKRPRGKGQGGVYCPTTEFILLGRVGKMPKVDRIDSTYWLWKRPHNSHSAKPEEFQTMIETVTEPPRLEMFARRKRGGWDVWGNEVESVRLEIEAVPC